MKFCSLLFIGLCLYSSSNAQNSAGEVIDTITELKELQEKLRQVVVDCSAATVGVIVPSNGASGSGVIVSEGGLILTAAHVVDNVEKVRIIFSSGDVAEAKVLGLDRMRDQGMLQLIGEKNWPAIQLAKTEPRIGEWVVALGHPGGYDPVRTPPVRLGRKLSDNLSDFITTDCKLIGGDSGGPLFNLQGELIAIHSSIGKSGNENNHASVGGYIAGWDRLLSGQRIGRYGELSIGHPDGAFLGVSFNAQSRDDGGVLITGVLHGGPAHIAGLRKGDLLVAVNQVKIAMATDLALEIGRYRGGEKVVLSVLRAGKPIELSAILSTRSEVVGD